MPTFTHKQLIIRYMLLAGLILTSVIFFQIASGAEEAQIDAALGDLSNTTGQTITSKEQAREICDQEQFLDTCAEIGKKHNLYTEKEASQVDAFLSEVKGKILDDIKNCDSEECLVRVAGELAQKIKTKNPTLAADLNLTTTIVAEKKAVVQAAKEAGVNFKDCESMDPDTAPVDLLRKCARLAKDTRVQKYIPEEKRALAAQFDDSATIKLREALSAGKYQCGDNTLEGCGNYCLNPDAATRTAGISAVCTQIASEIFGQEGVKQLESAHKQVGQVKDYYSKKFILTLPDGSKLVGEGQIRNACDKAFALRNLELAKACGNFAVDNGFATQADVDRGLRLVESFTQKAPNVKFEQCVTNPETCREFIPDDERDRFDAGSQIFEIMRAEIGFDPQQCERGAADKTIGTKCFEGSKRALAKMESLGLAKNSREAGFIIEDIKRHVADGEKMMAQKNQFQQVFNQQGGPGGCKSEAECFAYCSNPTNGPECIAFGSQQNVSGFRGDEAIQKFQEYNHNIQKSSDVTSNEYRPYPSDGRYPQFPGQGPFPGFQPGDVPPGQVPGFTQPGPGFSPPPGTGPVGPSPECFAAIQSGDFTKAKTVCSSPTSSIPLPTTPFCPASPYVECPVGQYRESFRNENGCWVEGPCKVSEGYQTSQYPGDANSCPGFAYSRWDKNGQRYCQLNETQSCQSAYPSYLDRVNYAPANCPAVNGGPSPTYSYAPPPGKYQCSDGIDNDNDGKTDYPADPDCYGWDDANEYYQQTSVSPYPTYSPGTGGWINKTWKFKDGNTQSSSILSRTDSEYITFINGVYNNCSTKYFTGWKPGGGDQNNWQEFGIPVCSDTVSTSPSQYPTYSPYPSPSVGNCPSGYHYHGESGGFCINDQENYGGTCYDSTGANRITCPAQPTYSPAPTTSGCSQSLINLLGTGCHWMYSDSSGRGIYCDGPMAKSAKEGDTATTAGCAGGYQPYPSNSPFPTSSYTPPPNCPSGQWWDYTTSSCRTSSSTGYCGNYVCDSGETSSSCPSDCGGGTTYTPYPTTEYTPPPSCSSGQYWNGSACVVNPTPYPTVDPATSCASSGGTWDGSICVYPTPPPASGLNPHYMAMHCQQLGRSWNGNICQANGLFARFYEGSGLASILRLFYMIP